MFLATPLMNAFDGDKDKKLSRDELLAGLEKWFVAFDADKAGAITQGQLRDGLNKELTPPGGGFGPPPGGSREPVVVPLGGG
jgi:hypothetical protein